MKIEQHQKTFSLKSHVILPIQIITYQIFTFCKLYKSSRKASHFSMKEK